MHKTLYVTILDFSLLIELCERVLDKFLIEQKFAQIIVMYSLYVNKLCGIVVQIKTQQTISHIVGIRKYHKPKLPKWIHPKAAGCFLILFA